MRVDTALGRGQCSGVAGLEGLCRAAVIKGIHSASHVPQVKGCRRYSSGSHGAQCRTN